MDHLAHHSKIIPGACGKFALFFDVETPVRTFFKPLWTSNNHPTNRMFSMNVGIIIDFNTGWRFGQAKGDCQFAQ